MELVAQWKFEALVQPHLGVGRVIKGLGVLAHQKRLIKVQQRWIGLAGLLPPFIEMPFRYDVLAHPGVIELEEGLVVHQDVPPAHSGFKLFDLLQERAVAVEEFVMGLPLALHQRVADEEFTGQFRIDAAVVDPTVRDDGHAVQRDFLVGHDGPLTGGPMGLAVGAFHEVRGYLLHPQGIEPGSDPCPQAAGFHQLGGHDECRRFFEQGRTGEDREAAATGAGVFALALIKKADVAQQP